MQTLKPLQYFFRHYATGVVLFVATFLSVWAILYYYTHGLILAYGDAESHINIAKRVVDSLTPGFAQLGGIWLPLPNIIMIPFVKPDFLWRTGLAGAIVSGICYIVSCLFLYKMTLLITKSSTAGYIASSVFALNPNILYLQSTPMSELPLLVFFILSTYFYFRFVQNDDNIGSLILAAFFGFCATLSRYDGWFLVGFEAVGIVILYAKKPFHFKEMQGKVVLFCTLAFFGIALWFLWDQLILGNALYFTNSQFSAKAQQQVWLSKGELPTYKNMALSLLYYSVAALQNLDIEILFLAILGVLIFMLDRKIFRRSILVFILSVPFIFYVFTLYIGESIIFTPLLTPKTFQWHLFNIRYGIMMIPFAAFFIGFLSSKIRFLFVPVIIATVFLQTFFSLSGHLSTVTLDDATIGLSASKTPDAQFWLRKHYDNGLILLDDYARTVSIAKSNLPIQDVVYIGNKPYWQESLKSPEKVVKWIILQKSDSVWAALYATSAERAHLYKYYSKAYTSPSILIFKRNATPVLSI